MKMYLSLILVMHVLVASAQEGNQAVVQSHYLLSQFTPGKVHMKSGQANPLKLNYNGITNEMVFEYNGTYLAIANPEQVDSVVIDGRVFMPVEKKFYEMLTHTPHALYREFSCSIKEPELSNGYGAAAPTAAANDLRGIYKRDMAYQPNLPADIKIVAKQTWWIKTNDGFRKFTNEQQLRKLFPDKKDKISEWVKNNDTNFSKPDDLADLVKQIDQ